MTTESTRLSDVKKDILHLYDEVYDYGYLMEDLDFSGIYYLPYWDYLAPDTNDEQERLFVSNGCMVIILAMAWASLDGTDNYIHPHRHVIKETLEKDRQALENQKILYDTTSLAVDFVIQGIGSSSELRRQRDWVFRNIIVNYYFSKMNKDLCEQFESNQHSLTKLQMKGIL